LQLALLVPLHRQQQSLVASHTDIVRTDANARHKLAIASVRRVAFAVFVHRGLEILGDRLAVPAETA
jgi:hypothetical protein